MFWSCSDLGPRPQGPCLLTTELSGLSEAARGLWGHDLSQFCKIPKIVDFRYFGYFVDFWPLLGSLRSSLGLNRLVRWLCSVGWSLGVRLRLSGSAQKRAIFGRILTIFDFFGCFAWKLSESGFGAEARSRLAWLVKFDWKHFVGFSLAGIYWSIASFQF